MGWIVADTPTFTSSSPAGSPPYAHVKIEVSNNSTEWTTVWENIGTGVITDDPHNFATLDVRLRSEKNARCTPKKPIPHPIPKLRAIA